jgi:RNA polymerase sigma-70 factor, ECF subfamily
VSKAAHSGGAVVKELWNFPRGPSEYLTKAEMSAAEHPADDVLLQRMMAGDEDSFVALYRRYQAPIYRFALNMSGSSEVAEEVAQDVFLLLMREPGHYDAGRGALGPFLYGVARNHVRRQMRRRGMDVPVDEAAGQRAQGRAGEDVLGDLARRQAIATVRRAVLALPETYREAVVLCDLEELSYEQAAASLGCAVGTVRSRLHRGRALLVEKLKNAQASEESAAKQRLRCLA